jgi:hypothetical protein
MNTRERAPDGGRCPGGHLCAGRKFGRGRFGQTPEPLVGPRVPGQVAHPAPVGLSGVAARLGHQLVTVTDSPAVENGAHVSPEMLFVLPM